MTRKILQASCGSSISMNEAGNRFSILGVGYNYPINQVSWYDAVEFCNKKSKMDGLIPCYSGSGNDIRCDFNAGGYRLPTEAEWEYAARGGNRSRGFIYAGSNRVDSVAWYRDNSDHQRQLCTLSPIRSCYCHRTGLFG